MSRFDNEQLAAFVLGRASEEESQAIRDAAARDCELCAKIAAMQMMCGRPVLDAYTPDACASTSVERKVQVLDEALSPPRIRVRIDDIVRRQLAEGVPVYTLRIRDVVDECYRASFGEVDLAPEQQCEFYRISARCVAETLTAHARKAIAERKEQGASVSAAETRGVAQEVTSFALSVRQPERVLERWARYEELCEFAPDDAEIYFLSTFAGRSVEEVAALLSQDVEQVAKGLAAATTEVQLHDEGGRPDEAVG